MLHSFQKIMLNPNIFLKLTLIILKIKLISLFFCTALECKTFQWSKLRIKKCMSECHILVKMM